MGVNSLPKTVTRQRRDCDPPEREHEVEKIADSTVPTCDAHAAVQEVSKKDAT